MRTVITKTALALAEYRTVEGRYSETLDALKPAYLDEIPVDFYAGAPLRYRRVGEAFLLYSVGENGRDDGGRTYVDSDDSEFDDLRFGIAPVAE